MKNTHALVLDGVGTHSFYVSLSQIQAMSVLLWGPPVGHSTCKLDQPLTIKRLCPILNRYSLKGRWSKWFRKMG